MSLKYRYIITFIILAAAVFFWSKSINAQNTIYFNGENITEKISTVNVKDELLVKATDLAEMLDADLKWQPALKLLEMEADDVKIKLMANSSYIQIKNDAIRTKAGLQLIDNQAYLPLAKAIEAFGYLLEFQRDKEELYIFQPETTISNVSWQEDGNQLQIEMDEITPYRVLHSDDGKELTVEIDKAEIDEEFSDNISNNNYYLKVENVPDKALLRLIIRSRNSIPFKIDGGVYEKEDALVLSFLPQLKKLHIKDDNTFAVEATGEIPDADIEYLPNSQKMIIDIPSVVIGEYELDIKENSFIKNVDVKQHSLDPVILRLEVETEDDHLLQPLNNYKDQKNNTLSFKEGEKTVIRDLAYESGQLRFKSTAHIDPETFLLSDPPRLVINLFNAQRGEDLSDEIKLDDSMLKSIRTARFDDRTVRLVADLEDLTGYQISEKQQDGYFYYTVDFQNKFSKVSSDETADFQNLNISLTGNTDYEVKKFTHPHRIVIDVKNAYNNLNELDLPENNGLIKEIRSSNYELEGEKVTRLVFELEEYFSHTVNKSDEGRLINIALAKNADVTPDEPFLMAAPKNNLIIIDAGHGGFDPGAIGHSGLEEKIPNLEIAKKLAEILEEEGQKALLTRNEDTFLSLQKRVNIANESNAELFVSIHANSINNKTAGGVETYYNGSHKDSRLFAEKVHDKLYRSLGIIDRGIKKDNFYVIKYTEMPSILIETAFLSNPKEEKLLSSPDFHTKVAVLIADGIIDYLRENGGR
ncbi:MAG: N-acetylmuramoyl-L-alanine amidase [Bacillota bacterium]